MKTYGFPVKRDRFDNKPRWDFPDPMKAVLAAISHVPEPKPMDEELLKLKQIYAIIHAQFQAAEHSAAAATRVVDHARKGLQEITDRIHVREMELGLRPASESDSVEESWERGDGA